MVNLPPALKPLVAVKTFESLQAQAGASNMKRDLDAKDVVLIGIGEIIGAGIFVITGTAAAKFAGPAIVLSFVIAGITCAFAGLCYSEMAACVPISGSAYTYAYATIGELGAWIFRFDGRVPRWCRNCAVGWSAYLCSFIETITGTELSPAFTNGALSYTDEKGFYRDESNGFVNLPAMAVVIACTVALCFGVKHSAWVNHTLCAVKLAVIFLFLFATVGYIDPKNWSPFIPGPDADGTYGIQGVFRASTSVFFAYIGFDAVSTTAQEVKNPARDMPIGIMGSLGFCTVIYILVSGTLTGISPYKLLKTAAPLSDTVKRLGLGWLSTLVSIGAISGLTSVILVSLMAQPRIFYAMAYDGLLPPVFGKINKKYGTPVIQTVISGTICALMAGFFPIDVLGDLTSAGTLFAFALVSLSVGVLRFTRPDIERPFKVPLGPVIIPALGFICSMGLVINTGGATVLRLIIWMAFGLVIYALYGRRHSVLRTGKSIEGLAKAEDFGGHGEHKASDGKEVA
ncbi:amino acid/polyamine transporter I [Catenaria anguillulae PL171]|uniref:Amino acid/polyamine transporter I n=1 Tax=Catenaria anguillulae PL171 TaxID=765915 RepID=A0A1Y2HF60_9FUNG|nr:amino acid/polyamine transporter I [Catenaria anguillulae PL171]